MQTEWFLLVWSVNAHSRFSVDISASQEEALWCRTSSSTCKDQKVILTQDGVMMRSPDQFSFCRAGININGCERIWYSGRALTQETSLKECLSDLKQVHFYKCYSSTPIDLSTDHYVHILCSSLDIKYDIEHWTCREGKKGQRTKATYFNATEMLARENQWCTLTKIIQDQRECWRMHSECQCDELLNWFLPG